jgi:hypothetical protein
VRDEGEKRSREEGGKPWRVIANELSTRIETLLEERHADDVAMRTMSQDVVRKADQLLQKGQQLQQLQLEYHRLRLRYEGADVQAEVEPEDQATVA